MNVSSEELMARFVGPYRIGGMIVWNGRSIRADNVYEMVIYETPADVQPGRGDEGAVAFVSVTFAPGVQNVTNEYLLGPPGYEAPPQPIATQSSDQGARSDTARVMVVHGRNGAMRDAMFAFLRSLGLAPIEWEDAIAQTGTGAPHNLDAVRAAMAIAQTVVVVLTAEDEARLLPALAPDGASAQETELRGQPRPNVLLEAGMALAVDAEHTILVEVGPIRHASDLDGLNVIRLSNDPSGRYALRNRLITAGCAVVESGDWLQPATGGDFERARAE